MVARSQKKIIFRNYKKKKNAKIVSRVKKKDSLWTYVSFMLKRRWFFCLICVYLLTKNELISTAVVAAAACCTAAPPTFRFAVPLPLPPRPHGH